MIALIALIPAVIVFFVAIGTESRYATIITAVLMGILGLAGGPAYTVLDVGAVLIATVLAFKTVDFKTLDVMQKAERDAKLAEFERKGKVVEEIIFKIYGALVIIAFFAALNISTVMSWLSSPIKNTNPQANNQSALPPVTQTPYLQHTTPAVTPPPSKHLPSRVVKKSQLHNKSPLQHCLEIRDETKMIECLEKTP